MSVIAIYPGTFDPITNGHIDIINRASDMFSKIIVTVAQNVSKQPLFSIEERLTLIQKSLEGYDGVEIASFSGLIVEFARKAEATAIIRGLRAISDFEYEFQMALMNHKLAPEIRTVFLMPNEKYTYLNSSIIRDLARFNADVSDFVTEPVQVALKEKYRHIQ